MIVLRRLWALLPTNWTPWAYRGIHAATSLFPTRAQLPVQRLFSRLLAETTSIEETYSVWISFYEQTDAKARRAAMAHIARFVDTPLISILLPVFDPCPDHLHAAIESVREQFYTRWELCIADSADPAVAALLKQAQAQDPRIRVVRREQNSDIVSALQAASGAASGLFVALLHQDARLSPRALYDVAAEIAAQPAADIIYSDEDSIEESGLRSAPYFKPDWNPELMLGQNLIGNLAAYRRSLVEQVGGFCAGPSESEDYGLALHAVAATSPDRIVHIPNVLYHRRRSSGDRASAASAPDISSSNRRAVLKFLTCGLPDKEVAAAPSVPVFGRVIYPVPRPEPLVSVVIPTRDHADMLARTMAGLLGRTDYPAIEVLIVDNGSTEPAALALLGQLAQDDRVTVLRRPGPFNFAALNNAAVPEAQGELILLLNNDIDVIDPGWLREMVSHAIRPGIGAVGAKLLFQNDTIQHGGLTVGMFGTADHQYLNAPRDDNGYFGHLKMARNVTAVTAACLLVRRQAYLDVDGLNEAALPVEFNDVDLCLKLAEKGCRNVWTPHAELYHLESASRGYGYTPEKALRLKREAAYIQQRWGHILDHDPCWNPNLSLYSNGVTLAFPPRLPGLGANRASVASRLPP